MGVKIPDDGDGLSMMALAIIAEGDEGKARKMLGNLRRMQNDLNAAIRALVIFVARASGNDTGDEAQ